MEVIRSVWWIYSTVYNRFMDQVQRQAFENFQRWQGVPVCKAKHQFEEKISRSLNLFPWPQASAMPHAPPYPSTRHDQTTKVKDPNKKPACRLRILCNTALWFIQLWNFCSFAATDCNNSHYWWYGHLSLYFTVVSYYAIDFCFFTTVLFHRTTKDEKATLIA